ncbi:unnamed protein product [Porites lobata]|uniref:Uncharacterized protein n=1 Tax=Porites lobata TaxID=104759 RepID=A0ABN8MZG7_9CNID|nr:unnamed protein product [Porites lobata]
MGLQNRKLSDKLQLDPNLTLEKATNLARQRETVKQQQNILDGRFKSTPVHIDGIAKGKSRRNKGNFKEKSQDKSKEKPSDSSKEKNPDQKCQSINFEVAEEEESFFLGEIVDISEVQSNSTKSPWTTTVLVEKETS